jgi:hypothetical protein
VVAARIWQAVTSHFDLHFGTGHGR